MCCVIDFSAFVVIDICNKCSLFEVLEEMEESKSLADVISQPALANDPAVWRTLNK